MVSRRYTICQEANLRFGFRTLRECLHRQRISHVQQRNRETEKQRNRGRGTPDTGAGVAANGQRWQTMLINLSLPTRSFARQLPPGSHRIVQTFPKAQTLAAVPMRDLIDRGYSFAPSPRCTRSHPMDHATISQFSWPTLVTDFARIAHLKDSDPQSTICLR